ncbi:hypothetical protein NQ315_002384 [Exocentrus adspersus]|uniref:SAM domain-containing protein n=1 Tax=Exocentrus adspersus TaxID=1586481 RepID=A0AAV8VTQ3_9CUCU|nr:hypothetical protein NQ315_002384 [Exocentrus adspersus]
MAADGRPAHPLPYNLPWSQQSLPSHLTQDLQLSELSLSLSQFSQNPFFGSLHRGGSQYQPNIVEVDAHPYYGLPDVILLQNYGMVPQGNYGLVAEDVQLQRRLYNEYHNSLMVHEMKKQFNSMLNLRDQHLVESFTENKLDMPKQHLYPNVDGNFMEMQNRSDKQQLSNFFFDEKDEYDQETENFFGKKPNALFENEFEKRPDQFFSKMENNSNLMELSEQFSDNFKDDSDNLDSSNSLYNSVVGERGDAVKNTVEDKNSARTGAAWVNFVNVNRFDGYKTLWGACSSTNPLSADAPDLTNFSSVEEWLNSIKMARYLENFHAGGINTMDAVVNLTVKELTELGITLVGHQKKIMNSVQNIRAQIRVNGSEGFLV